MKNFILLLLIIFPIFLSAEDPLIRVMTYNIRYDNSSFFPLIRIVGQTAEALWAK